MALPPKPLIDKLTVAFRAQAMSAGEGASRIGTAIVQWAEVWLQARVPVGPVGSTIVSNGTTWVSSAGVTRAVSANYDLVLEDNVVLVNAALGDVTVTLPTADSASGRVFRIKKTDASVNEVVVEGAGVETVDGELSQALVLQYENLTIVSDGSAWWVL